MNPPVQPAQAAARHSTRPVVHATKKKKESAEKNQHPKKEHRDKEDSVTTENSHDSAGLLRNGRKLERLPYRSFSSGLPFSVVRCLRQRPLEAHTHDFHEIVIITNGIGHHVTKFDVFPVKTGDVLIVCGN